MADASSDSGSAIWAKDRSQWNHLALNGPVSEESYAVCANPGEETNQDASQF